MNSILIILSILAFSSIAFGEKQFKPVLNLIAQPEHRPLHAKVVLDEKKSRKDSPVLNLIAQSEQRPMHAVGLESNTTNATDMLHEDVNATEVSLVNVTSARNISLTELNSTMVHNASIAANESIAINGTIPSDHSNSTMVNSSLTKDHSNSSIGDHMNSTAHPTSSPTPASYKASPIPDQKPEQTFRFHGAKSEKNDSAAALFVAKGKYVKTSATQKSCKQNQDCYHLREPDEWCPLPDRAKYGDKGCFCDHARNVCAIQRQTEKGDEYSDCAEKSTSVCASLKPVLRIQHGKNKKKRLRAFHAVH